MRARGSPYANVGLVLTGGGARSAYQVGALRALAEILPPGACPFRTIAGVSAGAINTAALAGRADDFRTAAAALAATWGSLTPDRVYRTDVPALAAIGSRWLLELSSAGLARRLAINHLLDTRPLRELLSRQLRLEAIPSYLRSGQLHGVVVSATNYHTGAAISFYDCAVACPPWVRSMRIGRRETITLDHVMASAAIPLFFPPVRIGPALYGDGCIRLTSPLSPAIHLGADRLVAIGVHHLEPGAETVAINRVAGKATLPLSEIAGVLLDAIFLDSLDADIERLERVNHTLSLCAGAPTLEIGLRRIPILVLRPSLRLGDLAQQQYRHFPRALRYLLRGIGADEHRGWNLLSYLAFEHVYIDRLMDLGYRDTLDRRREVEDFLRE